MPAKSLLDRLRKARLTAAEIVARDARYLPIFERIERELALAERQDGALARARAIAQDHRAKGASISR